MSKRREWTFTDTLNQGFILRGYEEDNDIVIMVIHESDKRNVIRFDQSPPLHTVYHSHVNEIDEYEKFPKAVSKEQKIKCAIDKLKEYIHDGLVKHDGITYLAANDINSILEKYKSAMLNKVITKGTIQGSASIRATSAILTFKS